MASSVREALKRPIQIPDASQIGVQKFENFFSVASHPFGTPVTNHQLLELALDIGLPPEQAPQAEALINGTGFTRRFISRDPLSPPNMQHTLEQAAQVGASLLRATMAAQNWDGVDLFIDTSAFLPKEINGMTLETAGLNPDQVESRSIRTACAGAMIALGDTLADEGNRGKRVVIGALEPLSHLMHPEHFLKLHGIAIPAIFGNDSAMLAFQNDGKMRLRNLHTLVQSDGGVIRLRTSYDFPSQPIGNLPKHYEVKSGDEQIFRHSPSGTFLDIKSPDGDLTASMDGAGTGLFFGDQTAQLVVSSVRESRQPDLLRSLGDENLVLHPASLPVVNRIAKKLKMAGLIDTRNIEFRMDEIGRSNSSSSSFVVRLEEQLSKGNINPRRPLVGIAPGIGSAITYLEIDLVEK